MAGSSFTPSGNVTLYAKWDTVYTVTFNANGGSGTIPAQSVSPGSAITLPSGSGLTRNGFIFDGWNTNASGTGTSYAAGSSYTPIADTTLYVKWDNEPITAIGANLTEKLDWLQKNAESHYVYLLEVSTDENIASHTLEYSGAINITVILRGIGANRTIRLSSDAGRIFTVNSNVTLVLDNNISLQGFPLNTNSVVYINGGTFKMNAGSTIIGNLRGINTDSAGGGVYVNSGIFEMTGGTISGNTANSGGGVYMKGGNFTMSGGTISNNTTSDGGGVYMDGGTFTMSGGTISGNSSGGNAGMARVGSNVFFTFYGNGGNWSMIYAGGSSESGNSGGGGVAMNGGTFNMRGGTIMGNTAFGSDVYGGGVLVYSGTFNKTGGTITGYNSDQSNGNVVRDDSGTIARRGHAVYVSATRRKETTAGPGVNLSSDNSTGWDN